MSQGRRTGMSRYREVSDTLLSEIRAGKHQPGEQLPTQQQLCDRFGVSRTTIIAALRDLTSDGYVVTSQGKGSFVAESKIEQPLFRLVSFTDEMSQKNRSPATRVVEQSSGAAGTAVAMRLGLAANDEVARVLRIRSVDGVPVLLEMVHLNLARCPGILEFDLGEASLYRVLTRDYSIKLLGAHLEIEATVLTADAAMRLETSERAPAFRVHSTAYDETHAPIEYVQSLYRGDYFRFTADTDPYEPGSSGLAGGPA